MDNRILKKRLEQLDLSSDEATLYIKLLEGKSTHLKLSRSTGITRSKVYRLIESLKKKALVAQYIDDAGQFIVASSPENLSIGIISKEERLKEQRNILNTMLPALIDMQRTTTNKHFMVRTYEGAEGFRQMLWRELKTKEELLVMGAGTIEELTSNHRWSERLRMATIEAGFKIRELVNENDKLDLPFTSIQPYEHIYKQRYLPKDVIDLGIQITIYNTSVNMYHSRQDQKIGVIIEGQAYTEMMRHIFEQYWKLATYS